MDCLNRIVHTLQSGDTLYMLAKHYHTSIQEILLSNPNINPFNLQIGSKIMINPGKNYKVPSGGMQHQQNFNPTGHINLNNNMRLAWGQHVYWTRMLLISIAHRLKDQEAVTNRLLQNPYDIANIFASYYPKPVTQTIAELLTEHLQIGAALITALRDGKKAEAESLDKKWYENADKMADTFAKINPYYDREELRKMLYTHLQLTTQEVNERLAGNYAADIEAFNRVEQEALKMADYFTNGLIRISSRDLN